MAAASSVVAQSGGWRGEGELSRSAVYVYRMAFALNLRFDLKRLSDEELVARLETAFAERETLRRPLLGWNASYRGFVRHPSLYRLGFFLAGSSPSEIALVFLVPFVISRRIRQWLLSSTEARIYLLNCEILDLNDEVARRVEARRGVAA